MCEADNVGLLVSELETLTSGNSKIKSFKHDYIIREHSITRWKFNEFNYYSKSSLPIRSRGLFIDNDNSKICIRGYDKFFNIDEVTNTRLPNLRDNTKGPYTVTIKENGCILFISGLKDGTLLVSSKNNLFVADSETKKTVSKDHAKEGYNQLMKLFQGNENRLKDMAFDLYENNLTAVLELCDDDFEEHVIAYDSQETAGLYLHGLNHNSIQFKTLAMETVCDFADKYGFKKVDYFQFPSFDQLFQFLHSEETNNTYKGKEIEGYVIRCFQKDTESDFFFKFKFEEPYLLYRQLREVTNDYINTRKRVYFFKKNKKITNLYLDYVVPILENNPQICEDYVVHRKGIIKLRTDFFKQAGLLDATKNTLNLKLLSELDNVAEKLPIDESTKYIIVPISILGLGKTTFTACLMDLYPKSITTVSSDLCKQRKNNIPVLLGDALQLLKDGYKIVVFDRNNHMSTHRDLIIKEFEEQKEKYFPHDANVQLIALPFVDMESLTHKRQKSLQNILQRGNEHPTIKAEKLGVKGVSNIINRFVREFKQLNFELNNEGFDFALRSILENETLEEQVLHFFKSMDAHYGLQNVLLEPVLSDTTVSKKVFAFEQVLAKTFNQKRLPKVLYFGVRIDPIIIESLLANLAYPEEFIPKGEYHVTVAFGRGSEQNQAFNYYLNEFKDILEEAPFEQLGHYSLAKSYKFTPEMLIYDSKAMAIQVLPFGDVVIGNKYPHITIAVNGVAPVYSNSLIENFYEKTSEEICHSIPFSQNIVIEGELYAFLG